MVEVLEHHALDAGAGVLVEALSGLLDRAEDPGVTVLAHERGRLALVSHSLDHPCDALVQFCLVAAEHAAGHQRERQRGRVPTGLPAGSVQPAAAFCGLLGGDVDRVVLVGEADGRQDGASPCRAADDQPRPRVLHGPWQCTEAIGAVVATVEVHLVFRPLAVDELELLREQAHALGERREAEAVGAMLALVPACAQAELDAPPGDVVDRGHGLGEDGWMAEGRGGDHRAEPDALRQGGEPGKRRPGVQRASSLGEERQVVVGSEQPFEPVLLASAGQRNPLIPADALLPLDHQADTHRSILPVVGQATPPVSRGAETLAGKTATGIRRRRLAGDRRRPRPCPLSSASTRAERARCSGRP